MNWEENWSTEEPHEDNDETMRDYLENHNMLDIYLCDGSYAEGKNLKGECFSINVGGDGDFCSHKAIIKKIK